MKTTGVLTFLIITVAAGLTSCRSTPSAHLDSKTASVLNAMSEKIGNARTIRLTARHQMDPALGVGAKFERGPVEFIVKRPNQFYTIQRAGQETREIAFDGASLCLMHPGLKHHALEPLKAASIEQFADQVDERFGFRPPVAELLASDSAAQMLRDVTSVAGAGVETVEGTRCERLHFEQEGMITDLWIGVTDHLPRRYLKTFTDMKGSPAWNILFSKWELNVPVDDSLFSKKPAPDSTRLQMLKSQ
jgi:hypothetical protein